VLPMLAATLVLQDRPDEALALTERAKSLSAPDDLDAQVKWRIAHARALATRGEFAETERLAREAVERAAASDTIVLHADALACLGDVLLAAQAPSEAVPVIEESVALYDAKGDVVSAATCRTTLDRLARARST
jgi:tetratricopeptide (TPR) repeat protein